MTYILLALFIVMLVLLFGMYVVLTRKVAKSITGPTPESARVEAKFKSDIKAIVEESEKKKQEVDNATGKQLLDRVQLRLVRKSSTDTTSGK